MKSTYVTSEKEGPSSEVETDTHCCGCNSKSYMTVKNVDAMIHCTVIGPELSTGHSYSLG